MEFKCNRTPVLGFLIANRRRESNPGRSLHRAGGSAESAPTQGQLRLLFRGPSIQSHCLMLLVPAPSISSHASREDHAGPCCLMQRVMLIQALLSVWTQAMGNLRASFLRIFPPGTYLIPVHISHVFEFWNPNSVFLWRLPHNENPQVSTFTEKEREISYFAK